MEQRYCPQCDVNSTIEQLKSNQKHLIKHDDQVYMFLNTTFTQLVEITSTQLANIRNETALAVKALRQELRILQIEFHIVEVTDRFQFNLMHLREKLNNLYTFFEAITSGKFPERHFRIIQVRNQLENTLNQFPQDVEVPFLREDEVIKLIKTASVTFHRNLDKITVILTFPVLKRNHTLKIEQYHPIAHRIQNTTATFRYVPVIHHLYIAKEDQIYGFTEHDFQDRCIMIDSTEFICDLRHDLDSQITSEFDFKLREFRQFTEHKKNEFLEIDSTQVREVIVTQFFPSRPREEEPDQITFQDTRSPPRAM